LKGNAYIIVIDSAGHQRVNTYVPYAQAPTLTGDPDTLARIQATRAAVVSDLFTSLVVKDNVYNISIPILRDGQLRFVLSLGLTLEKLHELLTSRSLPAQATAVIWDSKGLILPRSGNREGLRDRRFPRDCAHSPP